MTTETAIFEKRALALFDPDPDRASASPFGPAFGFKRMSTAMAIFENQALAFERGCLSET